MTQLRAKSPALANAAQIPAFKLTLGLNPALPNRHLFRRLSSELHEPVRNPPTAIQGHGANRRESRPPDKRRGGPDCADLTTVARRTEPGTKGVRCCGRCL